MLNASNFKPNSEQLTQKRVEIVLQYVIYCYQKMVVEGKTYNKSDFSNEKNTRYNLEERLSEKFVNDYLGINDNLFHYKNNISTEPNVHLYFNNEARQSYTENNIIKDDFIDIKIQETELSRIWAESGNQQPIHLAIECKVVENGYSDYVSDIKKMCNRAFNSPRLKFEGQIAYVTNSSYDHLSVKLGINNNLHGNAEIETIQDLEPRFITKDFDASYFSIHKRNHNGKTFVIYHLLFDYTKVVLN